MRVHKVSGQAMFAAAFMLAAMAGGVQAAQPEKAYCPDNKSISIFGYQLMNRQEREGYCQTVQGLKGKERQAYIDDHKKKITQRARDVGLKL
ncbi:MAG: hypothetical protein HY940_10290 [Gammaproteobacteria bacterium]|nr:hypothetical protein [Gammaproteobacteria bacterium]